MIDGIPASNSIAIAIGRRNLGVQISVKNTAIPKPIGTAINKAIAEVTKVPNTAAPALNRSVTGFQEEEVKNSNPIALNTGIEP